MEYRIPVNEQISLTPFEPDDKPNLVHYLNDIVIYQNTLKVPHPYTDKDAEEWFALIEQVRQRHGPGGNWVIRHQHNGLIGGIGRFFDSGSDGHCDEIGYWLAAPFRGKGLATQVVTAFTQWLFANTPLVRIEAHVYPHNPASARVLEKSGFQQEGYLRKKHWKDGQPRDSLLFAKIKP